MCTLFADMILKGLLSDVKYTFFDSYAVILKYIL